MVTNNPKNLSKSSNQTRIAQIVSSYTEPLGITGRKKLEEITNEAIRRLEGVLPGMERFIKPSVRHPLPDEQIMAVVKEIVTERMKMEPAASGPSTIIEKKTKVSEKPAKLIEKPAPQAKTVPEPKIELAENAIVVLEKRYLRKDSKGNVVETPEEMFHRVAKHIASAELLYDQKANVALWENKFYQLMASLEFLPNSPTLMNAGRELGQLSACFVIPVDDSMESIFDAVKYTALIHKSGGGTGFSFSRLRPTKDRVGSTGGVASGPISFMRAFDTATDVIKQGGMRRGANMAILNVNHPDILDFIIAKEDPKALTNFNLSVAVTAEFMNAVDKNLDYNLVNPHTDEVTGNLNAREVFNKIVDMTWRTGDPGIIFIDNINKHNPTPHLGKIESTNPCGEQPLLPFESCNLGSINLAKMIKYVEEQPQIDYVKLADTVKLCVRFLDNVIDVNQYPLPQIAEKTKATRKIGLGVMGLADLLIILGIPYDSDKALETAETIMRFISEEANNESEKLGKDRGLFPTVTGSIYDTADGLKPRNASRTTIAPTGTLSIIAGCSSGIEPLFALSYTRHILDGAELIELNPYFEKVAKQEKFYSPELIKQLSEGKKLKELNHNIPDWVKNIFVTSHDIAPEWHVKMQAAFQKYTDSAVSKTVNLPHEATREDVAKIYTMAYKMGLKGLTIYRDRSRETQVLNLGRKEESPIEAKRTPRQRPKVTKGITERVNTGCGYIYVTVNFDDQGICEVFSSLGKAGGCASAQLEATSRLISLALRTGIDISSITKQLRAIRCPSVAWEQGRLVLSCADAIGSVLEKYTNGDQESSTPKNVAVHAVMSKTWTGLCPDCGSSLVYQEGCHICPSCGYTKCG